MRRSRTPLTNLVNTCGDITSCITAIESAAAYQRHSDMARFFRRFQQLAEELEKNYTALTNEQRERLEDAYRIHYDC